MPFPFVHYQDQRILVVEKPHGLLSQPGKGAALGDSLISRIMKTLPTARLVHRLDRDTSGLIMLALDEEMHRHLSHLFAMRNISKTYLADVRGHVSAHYGEIEWPISKWRDAPPIYKSGIEGKSSLTAWQLVTRHENHSRVMLFPKTGRSHQLRVHMATLHHPILNDPLYDHARPEGRLRLHAHALSFHHPFSHRRMSFTSACPF